ncbi:hypothetical protein [Oryza sativa Japonica Group]|uniref:Uncharacterized protein n=1 Tax=Oryza sativa subsp. japonica TaxID=39947 RepID=Q5VR38_ORYSJ|nr:hypothetical protein [Oryza sativa Japonica Group]BAD68087.1 hypothetical protein [Oryza sativa Japonica Group]
MKSLLFISSSSLSDLPKKCERSTAAPLPPGKVDGRDDVRSPPLRRPSGLLERSPASAIDVRGAVGVRGPRAGAPRLQALARQFDGADTVTRAHDAAMPALRGRAACLNFSNSAWLLAYAALYAALLSGGGADHARRRCRSSPAAPPTRAVRCPGRREGKGKERGIYLSRKLHISATCDGDLVKQAT